MNTFKHIAFSLGGGSNRLIKFFASSLAVITAGTLALIFVVARKGA